MAETSTPRKRYFFSSDNDGHSYMVDAAYRKEWQAWQSLDSEDEAAWEPPTFAKRTDSIELISFENPQDIPAEK